MEKSKCLPENEQLIWANLKYLSQTYMSRTKRAVIYWLVYSRLALSDHISKKEPHITGATCQFAFFQKFPPFWVAHSFAYIALIQQCAGSI